MLDNLRSFDEYLKRKFPESRRKAYYLIAIDEHLPKIPKPDVRLVGWSKATEPVKVARRDREQFDCSTWLHKATELPKEEFKREVKFAPARASCPPAVSARRYERTQSSPFRAPIGEDVKKS